MRIDLTTYTQRRTAIAAILEPYVQVSLMADTTGSSNPLEYDNGLYCSWGDPDTGITWISVSIKSLDDVAGAVASHRYHVSDYALRFEDSYEPATAREEASDCDGEYIFVYDFVPPEIPDKWRGITWVAPPFPPLRPPVED